MPHSCQHVDGRLSTIDQCGRELTLQRKILASLGVLVGDAHRKVTLVLAQDQILGPRCNSPSDKQLSSGCNEDE